MFNYFSEESKLRRQAKHWLETAERVHDFRHDLLGAAQLQQLQSARDGLKAMTKDGSKAGALKEGIERLERALRECGGRLYPANSMVENVEFFLVAAIVILGLRAYFVQPFKIPTNSMWPSYYGMTAEVFKAGEEPGLLRKAGRLVALGAINHRAVAPADGEVMIPVFRNYQPAFTERNGRSMLIFPATLHSYLFQVAGQEVRVEVPAEFNFTDVLDQAFGGEPGGFLETLRAGTARAGSNIESSTFRVRGGEQPLETRVFWVPTGKMVRKGEPIVSFDILTGDLLFVERISYNFVKPEVGSAFVFRTENIHSEEMQDAAGNQIRQYYVKRLVGLPGDQLEVRPPELYRNGKPIDGSAAFGKNARKEGLYPGYINGGLLPPGATLKIPENSYFAMGDNSPRSKDSRAWGFVPDKDVVGRPLFIYYPLTSRWGPAH